MAPLGASSITTGFERFRYNNFNAFALDLEEFIVENDSLI
jgi:hypothetical protein